MEGEGASSSSSRPNRSNQQESGGEHPALSNASSLKTLDAGDLHFSDLTAENADEASLRKSYFRKSLCIHPDKGGSTKAFQDLGFLYEKLQQAFKTLRSLKHVEPDVTVASVTTSAKTTITILVLRLKQHQRGMSETSCNLSCLLLKTQSKEFCRILK